MKLRFAVLSAERDDRDAETPLSPLTTNFRLMRSPSIMATGSLNNFHSFANRSFFIPVVPPEEVAPRFCVICLASYRLGTLHGVWIDATQDVEVIGAHIMDMLAKSRVDEANEWAIYAYEGFESLELRCYQGIGQIHEMALFLTMYGKWTDKLLKYYGDDVDLAEEAMAYHYQGKFRDELAFAEDVLDKRCTIPIPKFVKHYIDYESVRRDIFREEYYSIEVDKEVHVFSHQSC